MISTVLLDELRVWNVLGDEPALVERNDVLATTMEYQRRHTDLAPEPDRQDCVRSNC